MAYLLSNHVFAEKRESVFKLVMMLLLHRVFSCHNGGTCSQEVNKKIEASSLHESCRCSIVF